MRILILSVPVVGINLTKCEAQNQIEIVQLYYPKMNFLHIYKIHKGKMVKLYDDMKMTIM